MEEFSKWEIIPKLSFSEIEDKKQADIIVWFMDQEHWLKEFPEDESDFPAGRGGYRIEGDSDYIDNGEIYILSGNENQKGLYSHEMGHVLGFGHPDDLEHGDSVMAYNFDLQAEGPTEVDQTLLKLKYNLPPRYTFDAGAQAQLNSGTIINILP